LATTTGSLSARPGQTSRPFLTRSDGAGPVGCRHSNFVKMAPLAQALARDRGFEHVLVHTGQHYDFTMSSVFFQELELPAPDGRGHRNWPQCGRLKWPHLRPTGGRLFGALGARAGGGGRDAFMHGAV